MNKQANTGAKRSLQEVMNMMARRVDGFAPAAPGPRRGVLSEAEAYASFDPLLAGLLKEYRESQNRYESLLRRNGAGDAMVDVAADMAGSADSAVETRLIELRADVSLRAVAEQRMADQIKSMNASARQQAHRNAYVDRVTDQAHRRRQEEARDSFLWMMLLWWMLNQALLETQRRLSLARDFSVVSNHDHRAVA